MFAFGLRASIDYRSAGLVATSGLLGAFGMVRVQRSRREYATGSSWATKTGPLGIAGNQSLMKSRDQQSVRSFTMTRTLPCFVFGASWH